MAVSEGNGDILLMWWDSKFVRVGRNFQTENHKENREGRFKRGLGKEWERNERTTPNILWTGPLQ
jgi:hypothetical protein